MQTYSCWKKGPTLEGSKTINYNIFFNNSCSLSPTDSEHLFHLYSTNKNNNKKPQPTQILPKQVSTCTHTFHNGSSCPHTFHNGHMIALIIPHLLAKSNQATKLYTPCYIKEITFLTISETWPSFQHYWAGIHEGPSRYWDHKANHPDSYGPLTYSEDTVFMKAGQQGPQLSARVFLNHDLVTDCACIHKGM